MTTMHNQFAQRLVAALAGVLSLTTSAMAEPQAAPPQPAAVGMVEEPCPPTAQGRTPEQLAVAKLYVADTPPDPVLLQRYLGDGKRRADAEAEQKARDWPDTCLYRRADAQAMREGGVRVVFIGDSITELWGSADPDLFTHGVVDRGASGQTSPQVLLRFYADVVALKPAVVHLMVGTNDVAGNTGPTSPEDFKNNVRAMVELAHAHQIRVVLASIPPAGRVFWRPQIDARPRIAELNAWLKAYAREQGAQYVDYHAVLAAPDGTLSKAYSRDGVHPIRAGYLLMRPLAEAAVRQALQAPPPQ